MWVNYIKKRNGDAVKFEPELIEVAIEKAYDSCGEKDKSDAWIILEHVLLELVNLKYSMEEESLITVEQIQDLVEEALVKHNKYNIAKEYILYRQRRNEKRKRKRNREIKKLEKQELKVLKNDGTKEVFDIEKIKDMYHIIAQDLEEVCPFSDIEGQMKKYITDGISTTDIIRLLVKSAIDLISMENVNWQFIAGRLSVLNLYKAASRNLDIKEKDLYKKWTYKDLVDDYMRRGFYYKDFYKYYSEEDIKSAGEHIVPERDMTYTYTTILMLKKRYLLNPNGIIRELPQQMYMSVALFLAVPEKDDERLAVALKIYDKISTQKISLPTPTLMNARTNFHQLSSCFKMNLDDDLRWIYHSLENMAQISKFGWGIGTYLGHIRSKGGSIRGINGASGWVLPWVRLINDTAIAVNQLGSRAGAISVTLDVWHRDIYDFLDMQTETGDIRRKSFDVFPSVTFPDLFMDRMMEWKDWTLFDPKEIRDKYWVWLEDKYGEEFNKFYAKLEKDKDMTLKETVNSKEIFKRYLKSVVETGMPYAFFRDTVNELNPNNHEWMVYSTQLCTEILQNASKSEYKEEIGEDGEISIKYKAGDTVVCNLASINMAKVHTDEEIKDTIPVAMRVLDNVIDLNMYPIKEAELTAKKYRSVGLGFMGVAEYLACNGYSYEKEESRIVIDNMLEKYAHSVLTTSMQLAKERWQYKLFPGSKWSKGILFGKDAKWFEENSEMKDDWVELIKNIKKHGLRFSYHLSPAPNTSTSLVVGTTAWVLPIYKKYYVETNSIAPTVNVAPNLNKENFWLYKEYVNMDMNDVIDMVSVMQKRVDQSLSFEWMINPMNVSPAQLYSYYIKAREKKIKTVYYVRSMSMEVKECVSCSG